MSEPAPQTAQAWREAGGRHFNAGRLAEAEAATREALRLAPDDPLALANLGAILRRLGRAEAALAAYDRALAIAPPAAAVLINRANLLNDLKRWAEALDSATRAVELAADNPAAHNARGNALLSLGRRAEAVASYRESARLAPGQLAAWFNLGKALLELGEAKAALRAYDRAVGASPGFAGAHAGRGHAFGQLKLWGQAAAAYEEAHRLDPDLPYLAGQRLFARMKTCEWRDFAGIVADVAARIDAGAPAATPFSIVAAPLSPAQQKRCAERYAADTFAPRPRPPAATPGPRLRVGYFSADFHEHATAYLIAEMLELHDRDGFEITAFSYGPDSDGPMRRRLQGACERFLDVRQLGAEAICALARGAGLDIAVDLKGLTTHSRPEIFAAGAAPIQVAYLGFPMTMGASFIDYIVADRVVIPPADRALYAEKVAWVDGCYQPNDRRRAISPAATTRSDHGLPGEAFVFASFNGAYKITPEVFGAWMSLLQADARAVLWLLEDDPAAVANLGRAAAAADVDPARLVFAPFRPLPEHLERIGHADLFVDTFPCSAHTTASDALWAGLPLLTCRGETFASRVAASLLTAAGLPELICEDLSTYRATALALSQDPARLAGLRRRLQTARTASALFDTPAHVRSLEALYRRMHQRRAAGLPPDHLD